MQNRTMVLCKLQSAFKKRMVAAAIRSWESNTDSIEDLIDKKMFISLTKIHKTRFLFCHRKYRKAPTRERFCTNMNKTGGVQSSKGDDNGSNSLDKSNHNNNQPLFTDNKFLQKYRMSHNNFHILLDKSGSQPHSKTLWLWDIKIKVNHIQKHYDCEILIELNMRSLNFLTLVCSILIKILSWSVEFYMVNWSVAWNGID